jgi:hypothetical protein
MVTEIARIEIKPGTEIDFEAGVAKARPLLRRAKEFPHRLGQNPP